jgi:uncharacterized protein (DUF2225 family)
MERNCKKQRKKQSLINAYGKIFLHFACDNCCKCFKRFQFFFSDQRILPKQEDLWFYIIGVVM